MNPDASSGRTMQPRSGLAVVILGAGQSRRMGRPKLLLPWGDTTVLGRLLGVWRQLGAGQIAVVGAAGDQGLEAELAQLNFPAANRIENPAPERGMFSSIQCAARWPGWQAHLQQWAVVLGDQPHLRLATLEALLEFGARHPAQVCQPSRNGRPRHPVLLPRNAFARLADFAAGNLRDYLQTCDIALCELDDPGLDLDMDRAEDYRRALALAGLAAGTITIR